MDQFCGGVDMPNIPEDIVAEPFYYAEQNSRIKILTRCVWEIIQLDRASLIKMAV
jgi:hypothetical protein